MATKKQKKVVAEIKKETKKAEKNLGKGKKKSMRMILKEAGYTDNVANNPKNVTESKGFNDELDAFLPNNFVLAKHKELMNSHRLDKAPFELATTDKQIEELLERVGFQVIAIQTIPMIGKKIAFFFSPDNLARSKALDMFYKLTGRYVTNVKHTFDEFDNMSDDELDETIEEHSQIEIRYKKFRKTKGKAVVQKAPIDGKIVQSTN